MEGAGQVELLGTSDLAMPAQTQSSTSKAVPSAELTDDQKDVALREFIELVRSRPELKDQVKAARNQEEVISLAVQSGFRIDSLTLLRSWSQVSDFSKPTWFGWFDD